MPDRRDVASSSSPTGISWGCLWCHGFFEDAEFLREGHGRVKATARQTGTASGTIEKAAPLGVLAEQVVTVLM